MPAGPARMGREVNLNISATRLQLLIVLLFLLQDLDWWFRFLTRLSLFRHPGWGVVGTEKDPPNFPLKWEISTFIFLKKVST